MKRKNELSVLNIIFCLLVIFIHVASSPVTGLTKGTWQYGVFFIPWRLSAFVVQGFIFLSGLKMFLVNKEEGYLKYCWSRFTKIVLPYVFAVVMFYFYFLWRQYYGFSIKDIFGYILKGDLVSHFYFVIIIVQFYVLKPLWKLMLQKIPAKIAVIASVIIMFLCKYKFSGFIYNDRVFTTYLVYWVLGCYVGVNYEKFSEHITKYKKIYISQFFVVATIEAVMSYTQFVYGGIKFLEELHFIYCISAILCTYALATGIGDRVMASKFPRKVDNASYYIYLIHPLFIFVIDGFLEIWQIKDIAVAFIIRSIITYTLAILISVSYIELKGKIKKIK